MTQYIALLRGINVGGKNKVPMNDLKAAFESVGFSQVSTYINSGNVIFSSESKDIQFIQQECELLLLQAFAFSIPVAIISATSFINALHHAPSWWDNDKESKHNIIFVINPANPQDIIENVGQAKPEYESVATFGSVIFWSAPLATFSRSRWSKVVATSSYHKITIRNANTAKKLLERLI